MCVGVMYMREVWWKRSKCLGKWKERILRATERERWGEGSVGIVGEASGAVVGVDLSGSSYAKHSPAALGNLILATAASAAEDIRRQVAEMTKPLTEAAGIDLPDLVPGVLGLREILEPRPSSTPASCDENWDRTVLRSSGNV